MSWYQGGSGMGGGGGGGHRANEWHRSFVEENPSAICQVSDTNICICCVWMCFVVYELWKQWSKINNSGVSCEIECLNWRIDGVPPAKYVHSAKNLTDKQRVLMHGHQGWNVRHSLCHINMIYVYIWVVYSFCLFCCLFIIVTTQFVALYKPCKPNPKPSTYDPPDNHPLAEIQRPILRPEPKQQICHQHANTDHLGK